MGYTHYWRRSKELDRGRFTKAVEDCRKVVGTLGVELRYEHDSVAPALFLPQMVVRFNGVENQGHETFLIEQTYATHSWGKPQKDEKTGRELWFDFCKTARKPYDAAVCACLIVFAHHFGGDFIVSSDGEDRDEGWTIARAACQDALGYGEEFRLKE